MAHVRAVRTQLAGNRSKRPSDSPSGRRNARVAYASSFNFAWYLAMISFSTLGGTTSYDASCIE